MTFILTALMLLICAGTGIFLALCICALLTKWIFGDDDDDDWGDDENDLRWR